MHSNFYCRPFWFYNFFCWFMYCDISLKSGLAWTWLPISHHLFSIHPKERTLKEEFTLALEDLIWWVYRNLSELNFVTPLKIIIMILLFQLVCYVHSKAMSIWKCFRLPSMLDCGFSWLCLVVPLSMHPWLVGTNCWSMQFRKYYAGSGREIDHFPFQEAQQFSLSLHIEEARMSLPQ